MRKRLLEASLAVVLEESVRNFIPPLLPYAWLVILWILTWEIFESNRIKAQVIALSKRLQLGGRILSLMIAMGMGAGVSAAYWIVINKAISSAKKLSKELEEGEKEK